jgi:hexosaminidase
VIPRPAKIQKRQGHFLIKSDTKIYLGSDYEQLHAVGKYLAEKINHASGYGIGIELLADDKSSEGAIKIVVDSDDWFGEEGYELSIDTASISLRASEPAGLFYAIQTLRQLLPAEFESAEPISGVGWSIPCVKIKDRPRFSWRGMHLDVCRHFFPKEVIKRYLDLLAMHKINTFHWHLTEDQGWRIEIKKYAKLTEIGAWRVDRSDQHWNEREPQKEDEIPTYGGYYTQDDIREIVAYADSLFITIVPEIEMPGHSVAALAAYPELSCAGGPFTVIPGAYWPKTDIYCAGNEKTFEFLENVLEEVVEVFPGEFIHVGGDEAHKANWEKCEKCQARIRDEGLKDEHELQSYFIQRIERFLNARNKRLIGWDEILEGGLAPNAAVMSWRGVEGGIAAASAGHDVVMSPTSHCYFDYYQARHGEPPAFGGYLPLEKVYSFEPIPPGLPPNKRKHILGAQGNVWTEYIPTPEHLEYMLLPRLAAQAEVVWSDEKHKDYGGFEQRMVDHYHRLAMMKVNFRMPSTVRGS